MGILYFDTSALAKRYYNEHGHRTVKKIVNNSANQVVICELGPVEMASVLAKKKREGELTAKNARLRLSRFIYDRRSAYSVIPVPTEVWQKAIGYVSKHDLRSLDSVHLAAALRLKETQPHIQMVTADGDLYDAADAEQLHPVNPE